MKAFALGCVFLLSCVNVQVAQESKADRRQPVTFDSSAPLESRFTSPPDAVRETYKSSSANSLAFHQVTKAESEQLEAVLKEIPAFTRQALVQHVRSISFLDGMPGNATTIMEEGSDLPVFNIVLRAGLLNENVSQFLTRKERGYYTAGQSDISLAVEAGSLPATLYVLIHESVHVLDISNRAGQEGLPHLLGREPSEQLVIGVWQNATTHVPAYQSSLLQVGRFGKGGPQNIDSAEQAYRFLAQTPFVSMYGSNNWYDDAAELITCYYFTQKLHQPYRIVLSKGRAILYAFNPIEGALVRARFPQIAPLFD